LTLVTLVIVVATGIFFLTASVRESKRLEQSLIDRFGWADQYTPAIDGTIPANRLEGFIRVREAVQPHCIDYQTVLDHLIELDSLETNQDLSASEKASRGFGGMKSIFSSGPTLLKFSEARNRALLAEEMGLGEYLYIYLTVYGEQLANELVSPYSDMEEAFISPRTRSEFVTILGNQLAALEASDNGDYPEELMIRLRKEIAALKDGSQPSPWTDGPTGMTRKSLAPFRQQVTDLYCSGTVGIGLLQKNRGFQFEG